MTSNLEELVLERLRSAEALTGKLCTFGKAPAIFYQLAPDDKQRGWDRQNQYPRVVFDIDRQASPERKSSGTLIVETFCDRAGIEPEELEPIIKERLKDVLMKPDGSFPYCFAWARTDAFTVDRVDGGAALRNVIGQEIRFDVIEYPRQETTDPDPVAALNSFLLKEYPDVCVLGLSHMDNYTEATPERPVVYCRLQETAETEITNTVVWMDARISIHVICSDAETRLKVAADIQNLLTWQAEIIMLDRSPMRPTHVRMSTTADYLKEGQVEGIYHYGVLRWRKKPHRIMEAHLEIQPQE